MKTPADDSRRSPRSRVFLSAVLEWPGTSVSVVLRDLSEHGALLEISGMIEADSEVLFRRNGLAVPGRVAWVRGKNAGVAFSRPLKAQEVLRYIARPEPREISPTLFRRPALTRPGMSAEEQRWANEIMNKPRPGSERK